MKVILLSDVKSVGKANEVVDVSDGYARNFLFPKKLASPADTAAVNASNIQKSAAAHHRFEAELKARENAKKLEGQSVTVKVKVGEGGKLFGTIGGKEVAAALKEQKGYDIDKKKITLSEAVKTTGEYTAKISLFEGVSSQIKVLVEG